ncbi:hypothetical protein ABK040_014179 [Willaertia magna]
MNMSASSDMTDYDLVTPTTVKKFPFLAVPSEELSVPPSQLKCAVIGVNSFIARHLTLQLLERGYKVVGTVRVGYGIEKVPYLKYWQSIFKDQLEIHELDIQQAATFDHILENCFCVFHTAMPFYLLQDPTNEEEAEQKFYGPSLSGVKNVLEACERMRVVRVIVTSSTAAVVNPYNPPKSGIVSECDWNLSSRPFKEHLGAYRLAKTKTEKYAWEFCRYLTTGHKLELVTILPSYILGEILPHSKRAPITKELVKEINENLQDSKTFLLTSYIGEIYRTLKDGERPRLAGNYGFVNVKDIALAHILALEKRSAKGNRFILSQSTRNVAETLNIIGETFIQLFHCKNIHFTDLEEEAKRSDFSRIKKMDGSKVERVLGLKYTSLEETILETCQSFIDLGFITREGESTVFTQTEEEKSNTTSTTHGPFDEQLNP